VAHSRRAARAAISADFYRGPRSLGDNGVLLPAIKLFSDGADLASLLEMAKDPRISGFTTNLSFEVFADDFAEMARQAKKIATWADNVYVKVPVTNTRAESAMELVHELSVGARVQLNVTALCTLEQVHLTTQALRGGAPAVVSVFAGRIADTGRDPMPFMTAARAICDTSGANVELLWASPREPLNIIQAQQAGAHIITVPPEMLKKMSLFGKSLADYSLDTVRMFHSDARAAGYEL
jgi:transaldolase